MIKPTILVTGASGKTGGQVASQLLAAGYPVRTLVRAEDARSRALKQAGATVLVGDLTDPQCLFEAMRGVQRGYFLPPFDPYMIQGAAAFAVAAREAKLEAIVGLSQWLANPEHPALATRQHWLVDKLFATLPGTALTVVAPGFFAEMPYMSVFKYAAHLGVFAFPARGSSRNAPPSVNDIARVAAAALMDPAKHAGKRYRPTGPQMLSLHDMAGIMGTVLKRPVRHVNMPMWMFYKAARMDGFNPFLLSQMGAFLRDHDRGAFELGGVTDDVLSVTGRAPESFETIVRRCAVHPEVQRSFNKFARVVGGFMSIPLRTGFNPERFAKTLQMPRPKRGVLSADSGFWRHEHGLAAIPAITPAPEQRMRETVSPLA